MGDIATNFSRSEFACKCGCGFDTVDCELVEVLQDVRDVFNATVSISSGCRCERHNRAVGGAPSSQHTKGRAADISVSGYSSEVVYTYLVDKYKDRFGFGKYATFVHVDTRLKKARW